MTSTSNKHNKYVVTQKLDHYDDISFRELFGRIRILGILFCKNKKHFLSLPKTRYLYLRSPHLTYPLHAPWHIRPLCTASIYLFLWLLSLSLPSSSFVVSLCLHRNSESFWSINFTFFFRLPRQWCCITLLSIHCLSISIFLYNNFAVSTLRCNSLFDIVSGHLIFNVYLMHLF